MMTKLYVMCNLIYISSSGIAGFDHNVMKHVLADTQN